MAWGTRSDLAFVAYRTFTRLSLIAPYIFHFATGVRGLDATEFGLITAVYYVATVVLEVPSGILADRIGRRPLLVGGAVLNAIGFGVLFLSVSLPSFLLAETLIAAGTASVSGADSAWLHDRLAAEGREHDYARIEGAGFAGWLITTSIGMPLADLFLVRGGDPSDAILVTIAAQGVAFLLSLSFEEPERSHLAARQIARDAIQTVTRVPGLARWIALAVGNFVLIRAAIVLIYNPWLGEAGVPITRWGSLLAVINLVGGLAAWQAHRLSRGRRAEVAFVAMPVLLIGMYLALAASRVPAMALVFTIQGVMLGILPVVVRTVLNARIPDASHRATVLSIESLLCRLAFAAVALMTGLLLETTTTQIAIAAIIALGLIPFAASRLLPGDPP